MSKPQTDETTLPVVPTVTDEDTFYPETGKPEPKPKPEAAPPVVETEPAEHETEPIVDAGSKSPRLSWRELRTLKDQALAQVELLKQQLAEREKRSAEAKPAEVKPAVDPTEPSPDDLNPDGTAKFPTYADFLRVHTRWAIADERNKWDQEQADKQKAAADAKALNEAEAENKKRVDEWNAAEKIVMAKTPDYAKHFEVFLEVAKQNQPLAVAVYRSEKGPELAAYLGSKPDELARVSKLQAEALWKAIGVLEDKVEAPPAKPAVTKAPPPLGNVPGTARAPVKELSDEEIFYGTN